MVLRMFQLGQNVCNYLKTSLHDTHQGEGKTMSGLYHLFCTANIYVVIDLTVEPTDSSHQICEKILEKQSSHLYHYSYLKVCNMGELKMG